MARQQTARRRKPAADAGGDEPRARLAGFVVERFPFAARAVLRALSTPLREGADPRELRESLPRRLAGIAACPAPAGASEAIPGVSIAERLARAERDLVGEIAAFLRREEVRASLEPAERLEILRGMLLTRATDNRLKALFLGSEVRHGSSAFQGKGFRSLGQEAIYAAAIRLRRGAGHRDEAGRWSGDVVCPMIRDLGVALAMRPDREAVRAVLNAQAGKAGPPMEGRDFHIGDFSWGVLPATAPLGISTATAAGLAMAFALEGRGRVAVSFIGEGGSSLGEWHEAINACSARRLPAVFCVQNNQTALSTPVADQSAVRAFADKAAGYGIPGHTIDGTDPDDVAAAFCVATERARSGEGPTLIELVAMRMCGHAHHDDMLYLGKEPPGSWGYPELDPRGYADPRAWEFWAARDPILRYAARLHRLDLIADGELERMQGEAEEVVEAAARDVIDAPWPAPESVGAGVVAGEAPRCHVEPLERRMPVGTDVARALAVEPAPEHDPRGRTFLEAVMLGVRDALRADERVFVYGQDVGGKYGNAFLLLRPLLEEFGPRILNAPLSEGGILGVCIGAALAGRRPIGEMQFNDFVATGFNQLVNNAAKLRYRWGGSAPFVLRMPWGGLRRAGPYHSQNTEPWFYRTPGLKIVAPSTPHDARALFAAALDDPDPVLFYEHIALYRDPTVKQPLEEQAPRPLELGRAAVRRVGRDLAMVSYGAFVHRCLRVAERLSRDGIEATVVDLRSLAPLDVETVLAAVRRHGKLLIAHEDSRTGGIGESLAAVVQERAFEALDAPIRIVGALDTPVPYSPPLEDAFLPSEDRIERAARLLAAY